MQSPGRARAILFRIAVPLLAIILFELGARIAATFLQDLGETAWYQSEPDIGWALRPGYRGPVCWSTGAGAVQTDKVFDARGRAVVDSRQARDAAHRTVVFIGDSNTFGWCVPAPETFVETIDVLLPGVSTVNLGVPGYSSFPRPF